MTGLHTPGPLSVEFDPIGDGDHATLVIIPGRAGQPGTWVANCFQNWREAEKGERRISWNEAEANALLFASGDDMLRALEQSVAFIRNGDPCCKGGLIEMDRLATIMEAAIAKAKGVKA